MDLMKFKQMLSDKREELLKRKDRLNASDPFADVDRLTNNAAVDADASEQFEHETSEAVLNEVDRKLSEVDRALERIENKSFGKCSGCGGIIPEARLEIDPSAEFCVNCESLKSNNQQ